MGEAAGRDGGGHGRVCKAEGRERGLLEEVRTGRLVLKKWVWAAGKAANPKQRWRPFAGEKTAERLPLQEGIQGTQVADGVGETRQAWRKGPTLHVQGLLSM